MPWIEHCSLKEIEKGKHCHPGRNAICISIMDPDKGDANVFWPFKKIYRFKFWAEQFSSKQAKEIIDILQKAKNEESNVVVHCRVGFCRSAVIANFGADKFGFELIPRLSMQNVFMTKELENAYYY